jgi:AsmA protein
MIVGPWAKPKIYPDIKGILENPAAAYEQFKQFGDGVAKLPGLDKIDKTGALQNAVKGGKVNKDALIEGLGGLLGGTQPDSAPAPKATAEPDAQPKVAKPKKQKAAKKKNNKKDNQKLDAEDAARQVLENFLTAQ